MPIVYIFMTKLETQTKNQENISFGDKNINSNLEIKPAVLVMKYYTYHTFEWTQLS